MPDEQSSDTVQAENEVPAVSEQPSPVAKKPRRSVTLEPDGFFDPNTLLGINTSRR